MLFFFMFSLFWLERNIYRCGLWSPTLMMDKVVGGRGMVIWSVVVAVDSGCGDMVANMCG